MQTLSGATSIKPGSIFLGIILLLITCFILLYIFGKLDKYIPKRLVRKYYKDKFFVTTTYGIETDYYVSESYNPKTNTKLISASKYKKEVDTESGCERMVTKPYMFDLTPLKRYKNITNGRLVVRSSCVEISHKNGKTFYSAAEIVSYGNYNPNMPGEYEKY